MKFINIMIVAVIICTFYLQGNVIDANAAENNYKIATVSIQDVLTKSSAGKEAKKTIEAKVKDFQNKIKGEQEKLDALRSEIEKKSSVWSDEVRQEKERDYQKNLRELQLKSDDAKFELQQLEKKVMAPILKELHMVFAEVGKKEGFTLIIENTRKGLESPNGLLYSDDKIDISDTVRAALEARLAK